MPAPSGIRTTRSLILCLALSLGVGLRAEETESGADVAALLRKAQAGDVAAQVDLANHLINRPERMDMDEDDERVPVEWPQLERWLLAASAKGNVEAASHLGIIYFEGLGGLEQNRAKSLTAFIKAAQGGQVSSMLMVADFYTKGHGTKVDFAKAEEWLKRAKAKAGSDTGYAEVADARLQELADARGQASEIARLRQAADAGDAKAAHKLYELLGNRDDQLFYSPEDSLRYLRRAAELGEKYAQDELANVLRADDPDQAFIWRRKAAEQGVGSAQYELGMDYGYGRGPTRDRAEAARWLMLAAAQGLPLAQKSLASFSFYSGLAHYEAKALLTKPDGLAKLAAAAKEGSPEAQFALGSSGLLPDRAAAASWIEKAAKQDHRAAMTHLAAALNNGADVTRNPLQSTAWYARAAQLGDIEAMMRLGEAWYKGNGIAADPALSRFWFLRAAALLPTDDSTRSWLVETAAKISVPPANETAALSRLSELAALAAIPSEIPAVVAVVPSKPTPAVPAKRSPEDLRVAAEKGDAESIYQLGLADIERRQIESNKNSGPTNYDPQRNVMDFRWIMSAARAGHPGAQFLAGTHWLSAETDAGKQAWLEKAAAQGHAPAKERLDANKKAATNKIASDAAEAKAAAEDEKLANAGDPDAAFRALRRRVVRIAKAITDNFSAGQSAQQGSGQLGYLDSDMGKWADMLFNYGHLEGLGLFHNWCQDSHPGPAYLALLLRRDLATLHPGLALKEGAIGIASPGGWKQAYERQRTKLTPAQLVEFETKSTQIFNKPASITIYGYNFAKGRCGFPQDNDRAVRLFQKGADAGSPSALYNLATCYWSGLGVPRDQLAAYDLMKKALAQGYKAAEQGIAFAEKDPEFARMLAARDAQQPAAAKPADRTEEFTAMAASVAEEYRRILALAAARGLPAPGPTPLQQIAQSILGVNESLARVSTPIAREALLQMRAMAQNGTTSDLGVYQAEQLIRAGRTAEAMAALEKLQDMDRVPVLKVGLLLEASDVPRNYSRARALLRPAIKSFEPGAALQLGNWFADARNPGRDELVVAAADEPFVQRPGHWPKGADWDAAVWWTVETRWTREGQPSLHGETAAQKLAALRLPADAQAALITLADYQIGKLTTTAPRSTAP